MHIEPSRNCAAAPRARARRGSGRSPPGSGRARAIAPALTGVAGPGGWWRVRTCVVHRGTPSLLPPGRMPGQRRIVFGACPRSLTGTRCCFCGLTRGPGPSQATRGRAVEPQSHLRLWPRIALDQCAGLALFRLRLRSGEHRRAKLLPKPEVVAVVPDLHHFSLISEAEDVHAGEGGAPSRPCDIAPGTGVRDEG